MKELILKRKLKFIQYLIATFMFLLDNYIQISLFALILGAIEKAEAKYYKLVIILTIAFILYTPFDFFLSRILRI